MKRALEYAAFLLLGALITAASIALASYVTGVPGGWHPIGIVTKPKEICRRARGRSKETRIGA